MKTNYLKILVGGALLGLSPILFAQDLILNGQTIELDPDEDVSINPVTGDITVFAADPDLTCSSGGPLPAITSFEVDPTTVAQGGSVEISWTSQDASSCLGQGNLPGWAGESVAVNGTETVPIASGQNPGNYTARLRCSNSEGNVQSDPVTVTVESAGGGSCGSRPPPAGMSQDTTIRLNTSNETTHWSHVWGSGSDFPHSTGNSHTLAIANDQYAALAFSSDNLQFGEEGSIFFDEIISAPGSTNIAPPMVVISECPGDFGPQEFAACRKIPSFGFIPFTWHEASAGGSGCPIEQDQDLYLNMVPTDTIPGGQNVNWTCKGSTTISRCGFITNTF